MRHNTFVAALAAVLISVSLCKDQDTLHITADSVLQEVCVNGEPLSLKHSGKVKEMDHLSFDSGWNEGRGCISVHASHSNHDSQPGILGCISSDRLPVGYVWQCASKNGVGDCCKSCHHNDWKNPDSYKLLRYLPARKHHNKQYVASLEEQCGNAVGTMLWRWDNRSGRHQVCCTIRACADRCTSCRFRGPGTCDSGKCLFGPPGLPPNAVCDYGCCFEITASFTKKPVYKIVNTDATIVKTCKKLRCLIILKNIETCDAELHNYDTDPEATDAINAFNLNPKYANLPFIQPSSGYDKSFIWALPWIQVAKFEGVLNSVSIIKYKRDIYDRYSKVKICFVGNQQHIADWKIPYGESKIPTGDWKIPPEFNTTTVLQT